MTSRYKNSVENLEINGLIKLFNFWIGSRPDVEGIEADNIK